MTGPAGVPSYSWSPEGRGKGQSRMNSPLMTKQKVFQCGGPPKKESSHPKNVCGHWGPCPLGLTASMVGDLTWNPRNNQNTVHTRRQEVTTGPKAQRGQSVLGEVRKGHSHMLTSMSHALRPFTEARCQVLGWTLTA